MTAIGVTARPEPSGRLRIVPTCSIASNAGGRVRDALLGGVLAPAFRAWFAPFEVSGLELLAKIDGPAIIAANHASHLDAPSIVAALPETRRRVLRIAAAEDYFFGSRARRWLLTIVLPAFPFRRSGDTRCSLASTEELLASGRSVLLFPEGTRSPDGEIGQFRRGVALIASRCGVPVIPAFIEGVAEAMPKGARLPRKRGLAVAFGAPLEIEPGCSTAAFADEIRERVLELREARRRGG